MFVLSLLVLQLVVANGSLPGLVVAHGDEDSVVTASAPAIMQEAVLTELDCPGLDNFGAAVAISGDWAVVGAEFEDSGSSSKLPCDDSVGNAGAVYVFARSANGAWTQQANGYLKAFSAAGTINPKGGDEFGGSVSIDGDRMVIGAIGWDDPSPVPGAGAAFVYHFNGTNWVPVQLLAATSPQVSANFGNSVAISGDNIVVGAHRTDNTAFESGAAYTFEWDGSNWIGPFLLFTPGVQGANSHFGYAVACEGNRAVVGSNQENSTGLAHVFHKSGSTWTFEQTLSAGVFADVNDRFGSAVTIHGDTVWVGVPFDDSDSTGINGSQGNAAVGTDFGSVYSFVRSAGTWSLEAYIKPAVAVAGSQFGWTLSLEGDDAVVTSSGDFFHFQRNGSWAEAGSTGLSGVLSADVSDCRTIAGKPGGLGSAVVYDLTPAEVYCTSGFSASGCQALISSTGHASASASSGFVLSTGSLEGQKDGLYFFASNGRQAAPWGNGTSYQCVVPPVKRTPSTSSGGTPGACDGAIFQDLNAYWCPTCPSPQKNRLSCTFSGSPGELRRPA